MEQPRRLSAIEDEAALRAQVRELRAAARPVVLVPTMGDLHDGHLSLVRLGATLGAVVVSIFVNPTQFGPGEDFQSYPRDLRRDLELLAPLDVVAVFAPTAERMYGAGDSTWVEVVGLAAPLCGAFRPGHFRGVTTVVAKLFGLVQPDIAVFGQKDAQQGLILHRMTRDLRLPVRIVIAPTVRDADGLALSSRNRYLSPSDRVEALRLHGALRAGQRALEGGERSVARVEEAMRHALGTHLRFDYAELCTVPDLAHPAAARGRMLLAVAAHVGSARLIDNLCLEVRDDGVAEAPLLEDTALAPPRAGARVGWRG